MKTCRTFKVILILGWVTSCVPASLEKYQTKSPISSVDASKPIEPDTAQSSSKLIEKSIIQKKENTYQISESYRSVFDGCLQVLIDNYIIQVVDSKAGVITTNFDKFYKDNKLFRNQVSIVLKAVDHKTTTISLYNNVETLEPISYSDDSKVNWHPYTKQKEEVDRIIKNLARRLNLAYIQSAM